MGTLQSDEAGSDMDKAIEIAQTMFEILTRLLH